jgi:hypothetical protein
MLFALPGCSTIGDLEVLNGTSLQGVREVAKTLDRTQIILENRRQRSVVNTGAINRKYGELKGLDNRKYDFHDVPQIIQSVKYIFE